MLLQEPEIYNNILEEDYPDDEEIKLKDSPDGSIEEIENEENKNNNNIPNNKIFDTNIIMKKKDLIKIKIMFKIIIKEIKKQKKGLIGN